MLPPSIPEPLDLAKCWLGDGQGSVSGRHTPSAELLRRGAELAKAAVAQDSIHNYSAAIDLYTRLLAYYDTYVKHEDDSCTQELIMSKVGACAAFNAHKLCSMTPAGCLACCPCQEPAQICPDNCSHFRSAHQLHHCLAAVPLRPATCSARSTQHAPIT